MKLIAVFLLLACDRYASAYWEPNGSRVSEECNPYYMKDCPSKPFCPYPDTELYYIGSKCCCKATPTNTYKRKMTLITAICGRGVAMQQCEDFPYCQIGSSTLRIHDRCCCDLFSPTEGGLSSLAAGKGRVEGIDTKSIESSGLINSLQSPSERQLLVNQLLESSG